MNSQIEIITCPCGESFEWNNLWANEPEPWCNLGRPATCPACQAIEDERLRKVNEANGDRIAAEWLESLRTKAIASMPPQFQATDINHPKFKRLAWDKIKGWEPSPETPWIGLTGSTGGCKSRIVYLYAVELLLRMAKPRAPRSTSETNEPGHAPRYVFTPPPAARPPATDAERLVALENSLDRAPADLRQTIVDGVHHLKGGSATGCERLEQIFRIENPE